MAFVTDDLSSTMNTLKYNLQLTQPRCTYRHSSIIIYYTLSFIFMIIIYFFYPLFSQAMTEDGNESQFQINHLSHFLLTLELLPTILDTAARTGDCRILILSSNAHRYATFDPANLNGEKYFEDFDFYCNSKLFNVI